MAYSSSNKPEKVNISQRGSLASVFLRSSRRRRIARFLSFAGETKTSASRGFSLTSQYCVSGRALNNEAAPPPAPGGDAGVAAESVQVSYLKRASLDKRRISGATSGARQLVRGHGRAKKPGKLVPRPANFAATSNVNQRCPGVPF